MPKLFISYRRKSSDFMYRVAERLTAILDADVFYDFAGMDSDDFEKSLMGNLRDSDVVLLIVTEHTFDPARIHRDNDWVRREIAEALRLEKPIVLALYEGLTPPADLPEDIRDIRKKHGLAFYREPWLFEPCIQAVVDFMCRSTVLQRKVEALIAAAPIPDETVKAPSMREQFVEALDALENKSPEKALFVLEALRDAGYQPHSRGVNLDALIQDAREAAQDRQARQQAALEYEDISEVVKRLSTRKHGLIALADWQQTFPNLALELDIANLLGMLDAPNSRKVLDESKVDALLHEMFGAPQTPPLPLWERGLGGEGLPQTPPPPPKLDPLQDALTRARDFIKTGKRNVDWKPFITTFNTLKIPDMRFCLVPTGSFQMGNDKDAYDFTTKGVPDGGKQTFTQPFYIAQYPVTNAQWAVAVKAGAVTEPPDKSSLAWYKDPAMANAPVVGVTWFECQKFALWAGCQLPNEREFEYAARGVENLKYPWGDEFIADNVVYDGNSGNKPWDVTSKPEGASWVGAHHLSGNVWEWSASLYEPYPYLPDTSRETDTGDRTNVRRGVRGGSWGYDQDGARAAFRYGDDPDVRYFSIGFRVVVVVPSS